MSEPISESVIFRPMADMEMKAVRVIGIVNQGDDPAWMLHPKALPTESGEPFDVSAKMGALE